MTQQLAESVKHLAKPCVEALGRIGERECPNPECDEGYVGIYITDKKCPICSGTGKVRWKWEPEVNQTVLYDKKLMFIVSICQTHLILLPFDIPDFRESLEDYVCTPEIIDVIPILEWEEIERVLEGVGYSIQIENKRFNKYSSLIYNSTRRIWGDGKTRQEAVMRAVIKLGEEIK